MQRTGFLTIAQRIIVYYCFFYSLVKIFAIFKGLWLVPQLVIIIALCILGGIGVWLMKKNKYNWVYVIVGVIAISALRYYEIELVNYLHNQIG